MTKQLQINTIDYARRRGITKQSVAVALKRREQGLPHTLPGVVRVDKFSRFYVLTVTVDEGGQLVDETGAPVLK